MKMCEVTLASSAMILCLAALNPVVAASCESLAGLSLDHATVTATTSVPAGTFTPPALPGSTTPPTPIPDLPAF